MFTYFPSIVCLVLLCARLDLRCPRSLLAASLSTAFCNVSLLCCRRLHCSLTYAFSTVRHDPQKWLFIFCQCRRRRSTTTTRLFFSLFYFYYFSSSFCSWYIYTDYLPFISSSFSHWMAAIFTPEQVFLYFFEGAASGPTLDLSGVDTVPTTNPFWYIFSVNLISLVISARYIFASLFRPTHAQKCSFHFTNFPSFLSYFSYFFLIIIISWLFIFSLCALSFTLFFLRFPWYDISNDF